MPRIKLADPLSWAVLAALVMLWGSSFALLKIATLSIGPMWVATGRLWMAALILMLCWPFTRETFPPLSFKKDSPWVWYSGSAAISMTLPFFCFAYAAPRLPSAVSAICNGATPIFAAILTVLFVKAEPLTRRKWAGIIMGFTGLVVLVGPSALTEFGSASTIAELAAITAALLYAIGAILLRQAPPMGPVSGALVLAAVAAILSTLAALVFEGFPKQPQLDSLMATAALGIGPTGLALIGYVWLLNRRGTVFTTFATYLAPLWATGLGLLLLGERPGINAFFALALILGGVLIANTNLAGLMPKGLSWAGLRKPSGD
mgnify:CR=1 FL=1